MNTIELEERARQLLNPTLFASIVHGAGDDLTSVDNLSAWQRIKLRPHVLRDVSRVDTGTTVLGNPVSLPVMIAPTGRHGEKHPDGEAATVQGAMAAGTIMVCASFSTLPVEAVVAAGTGKSVWLQLNAVKDRGYTEELIKRATAAGVGAFVLTVDNVVEGDRRHMVAHRPYASAGVAPHLLALGNYDRPGLEPGRGIEAVGGIDPSLSFQDLEWYLSRINLPFVVKGVLRGDDAVKCVEIGASAIIVSNHGGRHLDGAIATADALPEIVDAVGGRAEVYVDGGIRRGVDVVKALALGARAVLIGRPALWAIITDGANGLQMMLEDLRADVARAMALCGAIDVGELNRDLLVLR